MKTDNSLTKTTQSELVLASRRKKIEKAKLAREVLVEEIKQLSTDPFQKALAKVLAAAPSTEDLVAWAGEKPDSWANAVKTLAQLAGYSEKTIIQHQGIVEHFHTMSDAELEIEAMKMLKGRNIIDVTPLPSPTS
jgi:hypothetical protein